MDMERDITPGEVATVIRALFRFPLRGIMGTEKSAGWHHGNPLGKSAGWRG